MHNRIVLLLKSKKYMVKHDLRVTNCELRVTSYKFNSERHELKFKSASSNPRATSSIPQVKFTSYEFKSTT